MSTKAKRILAYTGLAIGALTLLGSIAGNHKTILFAIFFALAVAGPSAWWLHCEKKDTTYQDEHTDLEESYEYLTDYDRRLLAPLGEPKKYDRKWRIIAPAAIGAFLIGGAFLPEQEASTADTTTPTSTQTSTTTTTTTTSTSTSESSTESSTTEESTSSQTDDPEANEPVGAVGGDADFEQAYEPSPEHVAPTSTHAPEPTPTPAPVQPAPTPTPTAPTSVQEQHFVHPGAYCTSGVGVSKNGVPMVCAPAADGKNRWQSQ